MRVVTPALLATIVLALPFAVRAGHHQWIISELYSNHDGTIQFVELKGTANGEQNLALFSVATSPSGTSGSVMTTASLAPNLPSAATAGKYLLLGTAGYAATASAQSAPAPDRVLPDGFLELGTDTVRYAGISSTDVSYSPGGALQLPTDGVDSIDLENLGGSVNTPENWAGDTGSISAPLAVPLLPGAAVVLLGGLAALLGVGLMRRRSEAH